jgi:hypothetical protein
LCPLLEVFSNGILHGKKKKDGGREFVVC